MKNIQKYLILGVLSLSIGKITAQERNTVPTAEQVVLTNEKTINTSQLEFSPTFFEDGIVFISTNEVKGKSKIIDSKIGKNTMSIFVAKRDIDGKLLKPTALQADFVGLLHEGPLSFDKTNENIYFSRNNNKEGGHELAYKDGIARMKIYTSKKGAKGWGETESLSFNEDGSDACHPAISVDGDKLYFASNRAGGFGGMDIWVSKKDANGKWGIPTNLGPTINSAKNEAFPFIHADGTLYFSSEGQEKNQGGYDLYYSKADKNGIFSLPKNLGKPYNSEKDDFGLIVDLDKRNGYLSSNRAGGAGEDDIYSFTLKEGEKIGDNIEKDIVNQGEKKGEHLTIYVKDKQTGAAIEGATVHYMDMRQLSLSQILSDNSGKAVQLQDEKGVIQLINNEKNSKKGNTNKEGRLETEVSLSDYLINVSREGYQNKQTIYKEQGGEKIVEVLLEKRSNCATLKGVVVDQNDNPVSGAEISLYDAQSGDKKQIRSDNTGRFTICLPANTNYQIQSDKVDYLSARGSVSGLEENGEVNKVLVMNYLASPIVEGATIELKNIYYNFNDAGIRPDARVDLDALAAIMKNIPSMEIELSSHTDSRGKSEYNRDLSQRRAANAVAYLANKGISPMRMKAKGYGEERLRNHCKDGVVCDENEHQENRRTEVRILKMDKSLSSYEIKRGASGEPIIREKAANISRESGVSGVSSVSVLEPSSKGGSRRAIIEENIVKVAPEKAVSAPERAISVPSTVVPVMPSTTSKRVATPKPYSVVAGTYETEETAKEQAEMLQSLGYSGASVVKPTESSRGLYRVAAYQCYTEDEAKAVARELKDIHRQIAFVVKN